MERLLPIEPGSLCLHLDSGESVIALEKVVEGFCYRYSDQVYICTECWLLNKPVLNELINYEDSKKKEKILLPYSHESKLIRIDGQPEQEKTKEQENEHDTFSV